MCGHLQYSLSENLLEIRKEIHTIAMEKISEQTLMADGCVLHAKTFDCLTTAELYALLHVRAEVFVVEQDSVYQDLDYCDQTAIHLWLTRGGKIVAMCRICPAGTKLKEVSIGRVISTERGKGYGAAIFGQAIEKARQWLEPFSVIRIEAQVPKQHFYERFGFVPTSKPFMMEGRLHLDMELSFT